jgi:hypothetical protein
VGDYPSEEGNMTTSGKQVAGIFVDRSCQQWIVQDIEGNFWILPSVEEPWDHREPFQLTPEIELEPVPGHYKDMLGLPF